MERGNPSRKVRRYLELDVTNVTFCYTAVAFPSRSFVGFLCSLRIASQRVFSSSHMSNGARNKRTKATILVSFCFAFADDIAPNPYSSQSSRFNGLRMYVCVRRGGAWVRSFLRGYEISCCNESSTKYRTEAIYEKSIKTSLRPRYFKPPGR